MAEPKKSFSCPLLSGHGMKTANETALGNNVREADVNFA